ncbi:MAG: tetratricopeptide repeat protein [Nitrospirae bacterium]|nr:tetratricopeptide repeat protein [Nitrospirota bacterium]MBI3378188.1 tetratricopeptide repeat protein [Nitrospirota bacterium]
MSIIFKALKKAEEETKVGRETVKTSQTYRVRSKKAFGIIILGIAVIAASYFAGIYLAKNKTLSKLFMKSLSKAVDVKPKQQPANIQPPALPQAQTPAPVSEGTDTVKLHEDAIKQIKDKNYSAAESILRKAISQKPDDAVMHNHLGLALKNQGKYKEALTSYEKALKLKPDYYEAMNNLAVTHEILGDKKKAKLFYKKALSLKPSYAEAHLNYALLLEAEGDGLTAESHYQTFLNLSSDESLKNKVKERLKGIKK